MIETRQLSFEDIQTKQKTKYKQILEIISNNKMTAREVEEEMNKRGYSKYFDMNHVRPRLTELTYEYHELIEDGVKIDFVTGKKVALYRKATPEEKMMLENQNHYTTD